MRGYLRLQRTWHKGDVVELDLPMPVEAMKAHPKVTANTGRVALMRGPLVYCLESHRRPISADARPRPGSPRNLGPTAWAASSRSKPHPKAPVAIPFYANGNRGPAEMAVWIPQRTA